MKDLDPTKLSAEARQTELNAFIEFIEGMCVEKNITIGEWGIIVKTIDNRQNAILINNKVQVYAKPDAGGDAQSSIIKDN